MSQTEEKPVVLGRISGLFGVRGWVKVHSFTDPRKAILDYRNLLLESDGKWQPVALAEGKPHGKTIVVRIDGIDDRDAAAGLVQGLIGVDRSELPETATNEFYWSDLEGLTVEQESGAVIGTVAHLLETGANDVLVIRNDEQEVLIPFVTGEVVKDVDLAKGVIRVNWEWD